MSRFRWMAALCALASTPALYAEVKLPSVLASHMVLQRDKPIPIWGSAEPGEEVSVQLADQTEKAKADDKGNWLVSFPARKASEEAISITITGKNKIELTDILVGEVWVGSGQSNMEWPMTASADPKTNIAAAKKPLIRLFQVPKTQAKEPAKTVPAKWEVCAPETVGKFSAVLYYFGVELQEKLKVPVGLINSSWGGSAIEPWIVTAKGSGGMYNGMIAPLLPFPIRGITWYQGESNVGNGMAYRDKMETLITGWREKWGKDTPFLFVQIAPWSKYPIDKLPDLWEAQVAALKIPNTGMAVTTDLVDNIADIHPKNKKDVGHRLALWAFVKTYAMKDMIYSGPLYKSMKVDGNRIRLEFAHVGEGLKARDGKPLTAFEIAGEDGKFVPAEATIDGKSVVVSAKDISKPTQVRFGWSHTTNPNLANSAGLPASPFRTKDWKGGTGE